MGTQQASHSHAVYAPLAQLDRVFGYEPKGRGFESLTACQKTKECIALLGFLFLDIMGVDGSPRSRANIGVLLHCIPSQKSTFPCPPVSGNDKAHVAGSPRGTIPKAVKRLLFATPMQGSRQSFPIHCGAPIARPTSVPSSFGRA